MKRLSILLLLMVAAVPLLAQEVARRTVLLEELSNAYCGPCVTMTERLDQAVDGRDDVVWIIHHTGSSSDNLTIAESETLSDFFRYNESPVVMLDRTTYRGNRPGIYPTNIEDAQMWLDSAAGVPAGATVAVDSLTFDETTRQLVFTVSGVVTADTSDRYLRLTVYIVEDSIYGFQHTNNGDQSHYCHNHVPRVALAGAWGDSLTLEERSYSRRYEYTLPANWNANHCRVAALVNYYNASRRMQCQVLNATQSRYLTAPLEPVSVPVVNRSTVRGGAGHVVVAGAAGQRVEVYNVTGVRVTAGTATADPQLFAVPAAGIYIVRIEGRTHKAAVR